MNGVPFADFSMVAMIDEENVVVRKNDDMHAAHIPSCETIQDSQTTGNKCIIHIH